MKSLQKESHVRQKESVIAFIKLGICYFALVAFIFLLINIPKQVKSSTRNYQISMFSFMLCLCQGNAWVQMCDKNVLLFFEDICMFFYETSVIYICLCRTNFDNSTFLWVFSKSFSNILLGEA